MVSTSSGWITLGGIVLCLVGIAVCGKAGMVREQTQEKSADSESYQFGKGVTVAICVGVMSAFMSFAFKAGAPVQETVVELDVIPVRSNIPLLVVILWGGFITNAVWCTMAFYAVSIGHCRCWLFQMVAISSLLIQL